ncbi:hypothetical protein VTN00DRAFT_5068 [Thermoascus crustaceus]|uniref:uncharacterized protein n=1 Tax=Thermoascus crustaceus TaxID=5088 RepID=UPI003742AEA4
MSVSSQSRKFRTLVPRCSIRFTRSTLGITVDFDSVKDGTITLRDRDSTKQVRSSESDILGAVKTLVDGEESWKDVFKRSPEFTSQSNED